MGGTSSRFAETDWDAGVPSPHHDDGGGGGDSGATTVDGSPPTQHHTILHLRRPTLVNQREFTVRDFDTGNLVYTSEPVEGTTRDFDLFSTLVDGGNTPVLRIHAVDAGLNEWHILSYKPNWDDQQVEDLTQRPMYRKLRVKIQWDHHSAKIMPYTHGDAVDARGVVAPDSPCLLKVEDIASKTAQYQSFVPHSSPITADGALLHPPPLCGYWVWEHTPSKHQIKLHLAPNTDVALHCLLAIITNQVDIEKKSNQA